jgi:DNA polymerase alpha subunit A
MDNGMDDWTDGNEEDKEEDEEEIRKGRKGIRKGGIKSKPVPASASASASARPAVPSISAYRPIVSAEQEEDFMSSLLGTLDNSATNPLPKKISRKRKPSPVEDSSDLEPSSTDDAFSSPIKRPRVDDNSAMPATEQLANLDVYSSSEDFDMSLEDIDMDAFMDLDDDLDFKTSVKKEEDDIPVISRPPQWQLVYESLVVETEDTLGPLMASTPSVNPNNVNALEADGSMRFFWLDYLELDGKLYFIGKLKDKTSGLWVSCCVTVEGIERNLFVLPREIRVEQDDDGNICETDVVPKPKDVHDDFEMIRKQMKVLLG